MKILYSPDEGGGHSFSTGHTPEHVEPVVEEPVVSTDLNHLLAEHGLNLDEEHQNILHDALVFLRGQEITNHDNLRKALLTGFPGRKYNKLVNSGINSKVLSQLL